MVNIFLSDEQARLLQDSHEEACLKTADGTLVGYIHRGTIIRTESDEEAFFQRMKARTRVRVVAFEV